MFKLICFQNVSSKPLNLTSIYIRHFFIFSSYVTEFPLAIEFRPVSVFVFVLINKSLGENIRNNGKGSGKMNDEKKYTVVGTDVEEVKRLNENSGLSYNQVKELLAKQMQKKK